MKSYQLTRFSGNEATNDHNNDHNNGDSHHHHQYRQHNNNLHPLFFRQIFDYNKKLTIIHYIIH